MTGRTLADVRAELDGRLAGAHVVVFHRAAGFVHASIPDAVAAIVDLGATHGFGVTATDDPGIFAGGLAGVDVVMLLQNSGDCIPEPVQRTGLERFVRAGGGVLAVHGASSMGPDVARDWPWYVELIGASFAGHTIAHLYCDQAIDDRPGVTWGGPLADAPPDADRLGDALAMWSCEPAVVHLEDPDSPAIAGIVDGETLVDEWYGFHQNPRPHVEVVATVDESTYAPYRGEMGADHPIVWWREFDGGRTVYNSMGHSAATWRDDRFLTTIVGGLVLAAAREETP